MIRKYTKLSSPSLTFLYRARRELSGWSPGFSRKCRLKAGLQRGHSPPREVYLLMVKQRSLSQYHFGGRKSSQGTRGPIMTMVFVLAARLPRTLHATRRFYQRVLGLPSFFGPIKSACDLRSAADELLADVGNQDSAVCAGIWASAGAPEDNDFGKKQPRLT